MTTRTSVAQSLRRMAQQLRADQLNAAANEVDQVADELEASPQNLMDLMAFIKAKGAPTVTFADYDGSTEPQAIPIDEAMSRTDASDKQVPVREDNGGWIAVIGGRRLQISAPIQRAAPREKPQQPAIAPELEAPKKPSDAAQLPLEH